MSKESVGADQKVRLDVLHTAAEDEGASVQRRKLNLKAKFESSSSHYSFKHLVPGAFNMGFIGST